MTLPLLGPISTSGFQHGWFFLTALVAVAVLATYARQQFARPRTVLRFANLDLLQSIAPRRTQRLRHLPAALLVISLLLVTVALAGPTHALRIPRDRAVVMLVIDVSESMASDDVAPSRLAAAKQAGKQFADELTPSIDLGLVAFAGTATELVPPTTDRTLMKAAIDELRTADRTATGEGIFTALQAIASVAGVVGGGSGPPPSRIVLESDGKETVPADPDEARGAYSAARAAKEQGVPISSISSERRTVTSTWTDHWSPSPSTTRPSSASARSPVERCSRRAHSTSSRASTPRCNSRSASNWFPATPARGGWGWRRSPWPRRFSRGSCSIGGCRAEN